MRNHLCNHAVDATGWVTYLVQQNGQRIQEVVIATLKDVDYTDQAAAHVPPHFHLHITASQ